MPEEKLRTLLVFGDKTFQITVPESYKITFGPFSPPPKGGYGHGNESARGTLRIYEKSKERQVACFAGVRGFRDMSLEYMEEVAKEEGATIWKSDKDGYMREEKVSRKKEWVQPEAPALPPTTDPPDDRIPF